MRVGERNPNVVWWNDQVKFKRKELLGAIYEEEKERCLEIYKEKKEKS